MVSVTPNLVKEIISAVKGEFNSQDTGIGGTCPILGFRELVSLIVLPSSPSLVGDYLTAFASARNIAFAGQGLSTGAYVQQMLIDSIEERWSLNHEEKAKIFSLNILPNQLTKGCSANEIVGSPAAFLPPYLRASMLAESKAANVEKEDLDPNTRDSVFASLMHVKVAMSKQHRKAITALKTKAKELSQLGRVHQELMIMESLSSTMSSAKSRNLGRVAFRIRNMKVTPREYRGIIFQRNTMIESTLNWLSSLDDKLCKKTPSPIEVSHGNAVSGFVKILSTQRASFPRPPTLRRHKAPRLKKPKYILEPYGNTPFGQHSIKRSGVSVVSSIGAEHRMAIQDYLALKRHRQFSEHIEYGGGFVTSWSALSAGIIVALDITNGLCSQMKEHIKVGDFTSGGIRNLTRICSEYPNHPVLALHSYDGIRGLWHAIHSGSTYTVLLDIDINEQPTDSILHRTDTGKEVILALQGLKEDYEWSDTVPTPQEVNDYQYSDYYDFQPSIVRSVEDENILNPCVQAPSYSTVRI
jgi:hypothetical protein